jgi:hypothetical protein
MRTRWLRLAVVPVVVLLPACGDATGPSFNDISGSYSGPLAGVSQGIGISANLTLTLTQNRGNVSGSWAMQGIVYDAFDTVSIQGTGTLAGSVAAGNNPSVNITIRTASCPNYSAQFSGAYDSANRRITMTGPIHILSATCGILLTYQFTIILNR